jgi:hypothetical protein
VRQTLIRFLKFFGSFYGGNERGPVVTLKGTKFNVDQLTKPRFELPKACVGVKDVRREIGNTEISVRFGFGSGARGPVAHVANLGIAQRLTL